MGSVVSSENLALQSYAYYSAILVIKILLMAPLTTFRRMTRNNYASPEDYKYLVDSKAKTYQLTADPMVERVRRAHLNDLENIPAFMFVSAIYLLTNPSPSLMNNLMMTYTVSRIFHTFVYAFREVRQPARGISWFIGYGITLFMAGSVIYRFK